MLGRYSLAQIARAIWSNSVIPLASRTVTVGGGNVQAVRNVRQVAGAVMTWDGSTHDINIGAALTDISKAIIILVGSSTGTGASGIDALRAVAFQNADTVRFSTEALPGSPIGSITFHVVEYY